MTNKMLANGTNHPRYNKKQNPTSMSSFTKVNENQNAENKYRKGKQLNHD